MILNIKNLSITVAKTGEKLVKNISFSLAQNKFTALVGESGSGKTLTALSLTGLLGKTLSCSGEVMMQGIDGNLLNLSEEELIKIRGNKIGFIFQSFNLIDELSVFDNVALPLRYHHSKPNPQVIKERVNECLSLVGLSHRVSHKPNQLSGGQQQRVAIARALVAKPAILLVDEPTGNLDSKSGDQVMDVLNELNKNGTTICMVTHDPRYADMARTKIQLLDGMILQVPQVQVAI